MIQLRYFASLREQVGLDAETLAPDVGGTATTQQVTDAVCEAIRIDNV